jgi:hypothetical protein
MRMRSTRSAWRGSWTPERLAPNGAELQRGQNPMNDSESRSNGAQWAREKSGCSDGWYGYSVTIERQCSTLRKGPVFRCPMPNVLHTASGSHLHHDHDVGVEPDGHAICLQVRC